MSATYLENLIARRDRLAAKLAGLQEGDAGELANVKGEGEIDHGELIDRIDRTLQRLNDEIDRETNRETWDFATRGRI